MKIIISLSKVKIYEKIIIKNKLLKGSFKFAWAKKGFGFSNLEVLFSRFLVGNLWCMSSKLLSKVYFLNELLYNVFYYYYY